MSMRFSQLRTHWTADEAQIILAFLDQLRDLVWEAYQADIIEQGQREVEASTSEAFDDIIPF